MTSCTILIEKSFCVYTAYVRVQTIRLTGEKYTSGEFIEMSFYKDSKMMQYNWTYIKDNIGARKRLLLPSSSLHNYE